MIEAVWTGFLRLSFVFCQIRLLPVAKLAEHSIVGNDTENILDVDHFVPRNQVDQTYLDTAYYLHPADNLANDTLHALRVGMLRSGRVALGNVRVGNRQIRVMIEPHGAGLLMSTLYSDEEHYPSEFIEQAEDAVPGEMIEITEEIIARCADDFRSKAFERPVVERARSGLKIARMPNVRRVSRSTIRPRA
jgi:DNA end-binding protein Ku